MILKLLSKNPSDRFGEEFGKMKNHSYFSNFDWELLEKKKIQTPFKIKPRKNERAIHEPLIKALKREKLNMSRKDLLKNW